MNTTDQPSDNTKKEPLPTTETVSSISSVPQEDYYASRGTKEWRQEQIRSLRERLTDPRWHVRMPGTLFTTKWRELLGKGTCYQLLAVLMRTCSWERREWHGNIFQLAAVMGLSERTVRYQLNKLKQIDGFKVHRHPWSITIYMPDRIFPKDKREGKKV